MALSCPYQSTEIAFTTDVNISKAQPSRVNHLGGVGAQRSIFEDIIGSALISFALKPPGAEFTYFVAEIGNTYMQA